MKEVDLYNDNLKEEILNIPFSNKIDSNGNGVLIPESDYGFAEIYRMYDDFLVFLIPTYGGTPSFYKSYQKHTIDLLIKDLREIC